MLLLELMSNNGILKKVFKSIQKYLNTLCGIYKYLNTLAVFSI